VLFLNLFKFKGAIDMIIFSIYNSVLGIGSINKILNFISHSPNGAYVFGLNSSYSITYLFEL
jgi:hypothetical protein